MSGLNGDWTAIGTFALVGVTLALAVATFWLGWKTRTAATATREMADATKQLVDIEVKRRAEEGLAALSITSREPTRGEPGAGGRNPIRAIVHNTLKGEASNIVVRYRDGDQGGAFWRDRLAGLGTFSFFEDEFDDNTPADLHASGDRFMDVRWTDQEGRHSSPVYAWAEGRAGAPDGLLDLPRSE